MALQSLRAPSQLSARRAAACRSVTVVKAQLQQQQQQQPKQVASQVLAAGLALGISLSAMQPVLLPPPAAQAAQTQYKSLADIVRDTFSFVDSDKNGIITKDELQRTSQAVAEDVEFMVPGDSQLDFAMKLFDLNQDGTLTTDELLASIALDGAVSEDAIDEDVLKVFDADGDGFVSLREFKAGVPPLGPNGEATKEYIFSRVDQVVDGDNKLDPQEFANALNIMRTAVLGY